MSASSATLTHDLLDTVTNPYQSAPAAAKLRTVAAVYLTMATSIVMVAGLSTVLPVAAQEIGGADIWTLALTLGSVVAIVLMPVYGYVAARHPGIRVPLYVFALTVSAAVVLLRGFAPNMWVIVAPGVLLGLYSPAAYVLGYSLIRDMYDRQQAGIYLGVVGTVQSIGMLVGPALTGFMVSEFGWRSIHFILAPMFLLSALLMWSGVRVPKEESQKMASNTSPFDGQGAILVLVFLASTVLFLSLGRYAPFGSLWSWVLLAVSVVMLIGLILSTRQKGADAFIPAGVLKDRNTVSLAAVNFFGVFSAMAVTVFMPLYLLRVLMLEPVTTGIAISLTAVAGLFMSPIYGRMIGKAANARGVVVWASGVIRIVVLCGLLALTQIEGVPLWAYFVLLFAVGFYNSAGGVASAVAPQVQLAKEVRLQGNSIVQLGQNFGNAISIATYTAIITASGGPQAGVPIVLGVAIVTGLIMLGFGLRLRKLPEQEPAPAA